MDKLHIEIDITYGSEYQKEFLDGILNGLMRGIKNLEIYHKKNKVDIKITK